jgi:hypothetical protein
MYQQEILVIITNFLLRIKEFILLNQAKRLLKSFLGSLFGAKIIHSGLTVWYRGGRVVLPSTKFVR